MTRALSPFLFLLVSVCLTSCSESKSVPIPVASTDVPTSPLSLDGIQAELSAPPGFELCYAGESAAISGMRQYLLRDLTKSSCHGVTDRFVELQIAVYDPTADKPYGMGERPISDSLIEVQRERAGSGDEVVGVVPVDGQNGIVVRSVQSSGALVQELWISHNRGYVVLLAARGDPGVGSAEQQALFNAIVQSIDFK